MYSKNNLKLKYYIKIIFMTEELCSICIEDLNNEPCYCLPGCNHQFHTRCVINWFRQSGAQTPCPICRDNTLDESTKQIPAYYLYERSKELIKIARKKDAPKELKRKAERLKKIKQEAKEKCAALKEFTKENKNVLDAYRKLNRERWSSRNKIYQLERNIGLYNTPNYPLPNLIINPIYH